MDILDVTDLNYQQINQYLRGATQPVTITSCCGQRFLAAGMSDLQLTIEGVPGNALGAYLNGASITVQANAQDAVGDTMNAGEIIVHGSIGDAAGYAMRGGQLLIRGDAGYRAGIHMKAYQDKFPVIVIGGVAGSFLGEYQAGGLILVLGLYEDRIEDNCNFCATGMHGGKIFLRTENLPHNLPRQVTAREATLEDLKEIEPFVEEFAAEFECDKDKILDHKYYVLSPNSQNPYKQLYTRN